MREGTTSPAGPVERVAVRTGGNALLETGGEDGEPGLIQSAGYGREPGDDVLAVAAGLQNADDAGQLALGAAQCLKTSPTI